MNRLLQVVSSPVRIPRVALLLFAVSAVVGNFVQWQLNDDLKSQANVNNDELECRERIEDYVDGLSIDLLTSLGSGILDRLGPSDDEAYREAIDEFTDAAEALVVAADYGARSVEVCSDNPDFDPQRVVL